MVHRLKFELFNWSQKRESKANLWRRTRNVRNKSSKKKETIWIRQVFLAFEKNKSEKKEKRLCRLKHVSREKRNPSIYIFVLLLERRDFVRSKREAAKVFFFPFLFAFSRKEKKKKRKSIVDQRKNFLRQEKKEKQDNHSLFGDESSAQLFSLFYLLDFPPPQFKEKKRISSFFDAFFLSAVRRRCSKTTRTKRRRKYTLNLDGNEQTKYFLSATEKKKIQLPSSDVPAQEISFKIFFSSSGRTIQLHVRFHEWKTYSGWYHL